MATKKKTPTVRVRKRASTEGERQGDIEVVAHLLSPAALTDIAGRVANALLPILEKKLEGMVKADDFHRNDSPFAERSSRAMREDTVNEAGYVIVEPWKLPQLVKMQSITNQTLLDAVENLSGVAIELGFADLKMRTEYEIPHQAGFLGIAQREHEQLDAVVRALMQFSEDLREKLIGERAPKGVSGQAPKT